MEARRETGGLSKARKALWGGGLQKKFFLLNQQKFLTIFVNYANILKCVGVEEAAGESTQKAPAFPGFSVLCAQTRD